MKFVLFSMQEIKTFMVWSVFILVAVCLGLAPKPSLAQHVPQTTYSASFSAPDWAVLMYENPEQVEAVRVGFEEWRKIDGGVNANVKNEHTQFYKRWMRQAQWPLVNVSDEYVQMSRAVNGGAGVNGSGTNGGAGVNVRAGNWTEMGPWHYDPEVAMYFQVQSPGACHVYTVEQSFSEPDVVYAGTATAGMYRSGDKGLNWKLVSGELPVTGVYSIAIDPANADRVWLGSGNGKLYRSENGGDSWVVCGDEAFAEENRWYRTLLITEEGLFAATDDGLWFSDDLGGDMQLIQGGEFMELEAHPTEAGVMYSVKIQGGGTLFQKSVDGGMSFSFSGVGAGWPMIGDGNEQKRTEISVSAAEPDAVYALAAGTTADGGGLYGYYVSHDAGVTFTQACCGDGPGGPWEAEVNPNILGWGEDGSSDGGQFYYDLALGASPTDAGKQFAAGICVWRTEDVGESWDLNAHWVTWAGEFTGERYTHADVHDVKFFTQEDGTVDMWVASDGGVYYSSDEGDHIEPRMYGLHGTDFWGWQSGWRANNVMLGGTYHNGTLIRNDELYHWGADSDTSGGWLAELAGDNFRGFVNPGDPSVGYHDGGRFSFTEDRFERINGLAFDGSKKPNTGYWIGEYGNFAWDPTNYNRFYSPVGSELWRTDDGGVTWTLVNDFGGEKIISVKVAPLDPDRIYVSHKNSGSSWRIHTTADGGITWENVSLATVISNYNQDKAIYLDTDGSDPLKVYAALLGTQNGYQVFESSDAGNSWQNLTTPVLNDEHVISLVHQRGTQGGLYLGTTRAVYYRDNTMNDWQLFNAGLPLITSATFLQADYCGGSIRTAGPRSVHQSPFYSESLVQAGFMADRTEINLASPCAATPIHFSDVSVARCEGTMYEWTFEGGSPATSNGTGATDVYVTYDTPGEYSVTLTVTEDSGETGVITWADLITVTNESVVEDWGFEEDFDGADFPPEHWRMETPGSPWEHSYDLLDETNGVAQFPNYWVQTDGAEDMLITPGFDPTVVETFSFDYAHMRYSDYVDGLKVMCRLSGEEDWTLMWEAYGDDLSVEGCYMWFWYDTGGEVAWETVEITAPTYWFGSGATCAEIAFVNVGGYGNHIWIDNIKVGTPTGIDSPEAPASPTVRIYPNPSDGIFSVHLLSSEKGTTPYKVTDALGQVVQSGLFEKSYRLDLTDQPSGVYVFSSGVVTSRLIVK